MKPAFRPNLLITLVAINAPIAIPTTEIDIGSVDKDFIGLIYPLLGKGKAGDQHMKWFKEMLLDPFAKANAAISASRLQSLYQFICWIYINYFFKVFKIMICSKSYCIVIKI